MTIRILRRTTLTRNWYTTHMGTWDEVASFTVYSCEERNITTAFWRFSDPGRLDMMQSVSSSRDTWDEEFIWRGNTPLESVLFLYKTDLSSHAVCVVHRLHAAAVDALDVDLLLAAGEGLQTLAVVGQVRHSVVGWASFISQQNNSGREGRKGRQGYKVFRPSSPQYYVS